MGEPETNPDACYLFVVEKGEKTPELKAATVFYLAFNEASAAELCTLFREEASVHYRAARSMTLSERVRLDEAISWLGVFSEPDVGVYEVKLSVSIVFRARLAVQANAWEPHILKYQSAAMSDDGSSGVRKDRLARLLRAVEKHRLTFLYFAHAERRNPLKRDTPFETIQRDGLPHGGIPSSAIDAEGEFLFEYRGVLDRFSQVVMARFGVDDGRPSVHIESDGSSTEVEGGSPPYWRIDEDGCIYLERSADKVLEACREYLQSDPSDRKVVDQVRQTTHDEGRDHWYPTWAVRYRYLERLDSCIRMLKHVEFDKAAANTEDGRKVPKTAAIETQASHASATDGEKTEDVDMSAIGEMSLADRRVSSLILLLLFAQAYYKLLESSISMASWVSSLDLELNQSYFWVVSSIEALLRNAEDLTDFPSNFEPLFPDLYPETVADYDWQYGVAIEAQQFLSSVQKYVLKKGIYEPTAGSEAWVMVELYRPGINNAIKAAEDYYDRMQAAWQQLMKNADTERKTRTGKASYEAKNSGSERDENCPPVVEPARPSYEATRMIEEKEKSNHYDVFLCHNSKDKPAVIQIGMQLIARGIRPWLDEWELPPGRPWVPELEKQIKNVKSAAVFVGGFDLGPWQNLEVEGLLRHFVRDGRSIIPVIIEGGRKRRNVPFFLEGFTWVDFRKSEPDPMRGLIWGITGEKQR